MNLLFKTAEKEPAQKNTEYVKESLAVAKEDRDRVGVILQYKLIETSDASAGCGDPEADGREESLCTVYSVLIVKTSSNCLGVYDETVFIYDLTRNKETALEMIRLLSENLVTPDEARDVIDDLL